MAHWPGAYDLAEHSVGLLIERGTAKNSIRPLRRARPANRERFSLSLGAIRPAQMEPTLPVLRNSPRRRIRERRLTRA